MGKMMKHWGFLDHLQCPCCQHIKEDKAHILTCSVVSSIAKWSKSVQGLSEWLQERDRIPAI
jgi:hypothetical protein